jgi:hypothetical protein
MVCILVTAGNPRGQQAVQDSLGHAHMPAHAEKGANRTHSSTAMVKKKKRRQQGASRENSRAPKLRSPAALLLRVHLRSGASKPPTVHETAKKILVNIFQALFTA